ncbi:phosphatases II [Bimuria novae-zelandiae CBS 107.79]|uniref:protein-tyrosine-phosphatase n=1 Tax=Bimuria novae-zelandiae CBS 107.79 TaxID=1447943 RepID=A0A6A5VNP0_9PLEO|nr:phosphatases II [Bimuria novae-zelandiae CBS 107.79]
MSYLLHGSACHTAMGYLGLIPRAGNLYIGGLYALHQQHLLQALPITHVLSVVDYEPNLSKLTHLKGVKKMHVWVQDDPDEDLLKWFEKTGGFIKKALEGSGGVFVHCAMGKSRSAAVVVAWLVERYGVSWEEGLKQVEEGRPVCDPNPGFKEQLAVWERIVKEKDEGKRKEMYKEWENARFRGSAWEWEKRTEEKKEKARL